MVTCRAIFNTTIIVVAVITISFVTKIICDEQTKPYNVNNGLKFVHVVFRHGDRTPADTYPSDPLTNFTFYPWGWGQLTGEGKQNTYSLGRWLRQRYDGFLGQILMPDIFQAYSTDVDRTKMSAQLVCAGLWPPKGEQIWGDLNWQPVPLRVEPLNQDKLLLVRVPCPVYSIERERVETSNEIQNIYKANKMLLDHLTNYTGWPITNADDVQNLYGTLRAEHDFNLTLPSWTKGIYPNQLLPLTELSYLLPSYTPLLRRLKGGLLLKHLISDWTSVSKNKTAKKMSVFAGHDSTVSNLLSTLNVWTSQIPEYSIAALFELRQNQNGVFTLEVFLKNSTSPPVQLQIPGCGQICTLPEVLKLTEPVVPKNWELECKTDDPNYTPPPPKGP